MGLDVEGLMEVVWNMKLLYQLDFWQVLYWYPQRNKRDKCPSVQVALASRETKGKR
jgi:hypothetical protein